MSTSGLYQFRLSYQISPIILTGGLAANVPGGAIPIIQLLQPGDFDGLSGGGDIQDLDSCFAHFEPQPGSTLLDYKFGEYPFANQAVAANAIISQPLRVSLLMKCPVKGSDTYADKLQTITSLRSSLNQHALLGGTYTIATPSYFWTNTLLISFSDVSSGETEQRQYQWALEFEQPLLTLQDAQQAMNNLMTTLNNGSQINGQPAWSGGGQTVGQSNSASGPFTVPSLGGAAGGGIGVPD